MMDTACLVSHIFVCFAGVMFLSGRMEELGSTYAVIIILITVLVFANLFTGAKREAVENLPLLGLLMQPAFWLRYVRPVFTALVEFGWSSLIYTFHAALSGQPTAHMATQRLRHQNARSALHEKREALMDRLTWYFPDGVREMQVARLRILAHTRGWTYALSKDGHRWAKRWLRHSKTSLRDGEFFVRWIEELEKYAQKLTPKEKGGEEEDDDDEEEEEEEDEEEEEGRRRGRRRGDIGCSGS